MSQALVTFYFEDDAGKVAQIGFWFDAAVLDLEGGGVGVQAVRDALINLSSARLTHYEIVYKSGPLSTPPAQAGSTVYRRLSLLYREGDNFGSILLPCPADLSATGNEPYGTLRLTRGEAILSGMLDDLEAIVAGSLKRGGEPFPATFYLGGAAGGEL